MRGQVDAEYGQEKTAVPCLKQETLFSIVDKIANKLRQTGDTLETVSSHLKRLPGQGQQGGNPKDTQRSLMEALEELNDIANEVSKEANFIAETVG